MSKKPATKTASAGPGGEIDERDLAVRLERDRGGPANAQLKVLGKLLALAGDGQEIERPNLTTLAKEIGLSRQSVANALCRLRQRQLVDEREMTIPVVSRHRKVRFVVPHMPNELRQLALPFDSEAAA
jgi:hypothetical protein